MKRGILWVFMLSLVGVGGLFSAHAASFNSSNFSINGNLGDSVAGGQNSTNYQLTSAAGESIAGTSSSASYKLGQGYIATLERSLQLTVQPNGLTAYFPFSEGSGLRTYDESSSNNIGTVRTSSSWTPSGKVGSALVAVNAAANEVDVPHSASLNQPAAFTVSGWVKVGTTLSGFKNILEKGTTSATDMNYKVAINHATGNLLVGGTFNVAGTPTAQDVGSSVSVNDGLWHHFVYTVDGSTLKVYVDGVQRNQIAQPGSVITNTLPLEIAPASSFDGQLDEIKVYSRALSSLEIKADYDAGALGIPAGLGFASLTPGASQVQPFDTVVQTDSPGYTLAVNQNNNLTNGGSTIPAVSGSIGSPVSWSEGSTKGLGFTLYGTNATALPGSWASGASYAALPASSTSFYTRTGYNGGAKDVVNMRLRLDVTTGQLAGNYTNQMTITGTMTP